MMKIASKPLIILLIAGSLLIILAGIAGISYFRSREDHFQSKYEFSKSGGVVEITSAEEAIQRFFASPTPMETPAFATSNEVSKDEAIIIAKTFLRNQKEENNFFPEPVSVGGDHPQVGTWYVAFKKSKPLPSPAPGAITIPPPSDTANIMVNKSSGEARWEPLE